jgi:hypothetical protein
MNEQEIKIALIEKVLAATSADDELISLLNLDISKVIEDAATEKMASMTIEELLELL